MEKLLSILIFLHIFLPSQSQEGPKKILVIEGIQFFLFPGEINSGHNVQFPHSPAEKEFQNKILDSLLKFQAHSLGYDSLLISTMQIDYRINSILSHIKPEKQKTAPEHFHFARITSFINYSVSPSYTFELGTLFFITNNKRQKILLKRFSQPFNILPTEQIAGDTLISKGDFLQLYSSSLKQALNNTTNDSILSFVQPPSNRYTSFLKKADQLESYLIDSSYFLDNTLPSTLSQLTYSLYNGSDWYSNLFTVGYRNDTLKIYLSNTTTKQFLLLEGSKSFDFVMNTFTSKVKGVFYNDNSIRGVFNYSNNGLLIGNLDSNKIEIRWKEIALVAEIWENDKMIAIIHDLPEKRTLFTLNVLPITYSELLTLVAIYDFTFFAQQKLENLTIDSSTYLPIAE